MPSNEMPAPDGRDGLALPWGGMKRARSVRILDSVHAFVAVLCEAEVLFRKSSTSRVQKMHQPLRLIEI